MSLKLTEKEVEDLLEQEWYIVRNSGETPEIALHSSLYYLTRGHDGPNIEVSNEQIAVLQHAASERFEDIIFRDIDVRNVGTTEYRGLERTIVNYRRYVKFCERQDLENSVVEKLCLRLEVFLGQEIHLLTDESRRLVLACHFGDVVAFLEELAIHCEGVDALSHGIAGYFPE